MLISCMVSHGITVWVLLCVLTSYQHFFLITLQSWLSAREAESLIEICIKPISVLSLYSLEFLLDNVILIPAWSLTVAHQRCVSCAAHPCLCTKFDINGLSWGIVVNSPTQFLLFCTWVLSEPLLQPLYFVLPVHCGVSDNFSLGTVVGVSSCPSVYKSESGCVWVWLTAHCGGEWLETL